ncbi:hypothetical protein PHAVU_003G115700 [Phaseolus vulgaris]|uniref:PB1-like domain-containing protein n=1 Tax=Phaseolus vulgaris TaxID=3885 RepID=V7CAK2_PHAVU|nr:hypothetical protein PHAVU_003G115700g [Phaseolus vulgaris]ESW26388.1 hypothetical protein PHAVU_003G115700g [Phaseolus vulgaris]
MSLDDWGYSSTLVKCDPVKYDCVGQRFSCGHYSGTFSDGKYVGGDTSTWSCASDTWSYFEIVGIVKEMGFLTIHEMWHSRGGCEVLETRLQLMVGDGGAIDTLKVANTYFEVHLFLMHVVSEAKVMLVLGDGFECEVEGEDDVSEPYGVEDGVGDVDGVEDDVDDNPEDNGVKGDVEEDNEEEEFSVDEKLDGVEGDSEDDGGEDVGEHDGVDGVVEEDDDEEEEFHASLKGDVEDDGGEDIGEHDGVEGVVEEDDDDEEFRVGVEGDVEDDDGEDIGEQEEMECDHDEGLEPNSTDDLQNLGVDDDESKGTVVHDRGLSDTKWESEELDNMDEVEDGEEDISTGDNEAFKDTIRAYAVHSGRKMTLVKMIIQEFVYAVVEPKDIVNGFNSVLLAVRAKPIITMVEDIRTYIMQIWAKNILKIASFEGSICPKILSRLQKEANQT